MLVGLTGNDSPTVSIYSGWLSVAIFANTASVAKAYAWRPALLGESIGSIGLMLVAAALALPAVAIQRKSLVGGTISWAETGIAIRNQFELRNGQVAITAWSCS
jgi:hypothetical protein